MSKTQRIIITNYTGSITQQRGLVFGRHHVENGMLEAVDDLNKPA